MNRLTAYVLAVALPAAASFSACTTSSSGPQTQCVSQSYPELACKTIQSCANGSGNACTSTYLLLPDGQKFTCASCNDCTDGQKQAVAACNGGAGDAGNEDAGTGEDAAPGQDAAHGEDAAPGEDAGEDAGAD